MAQAARLGLRLQKELKLLLSDPPPRASFPRLSSAISGSGDISTLSTIDAEIEGPEGTVYANGIFTLKIQIPDRYPFQPPIVTFATPIYHPNIDNGGRICLDILNLPPKGAWQPSLNVSTVLTSIGLLLSEPNPDDGLMCEASREYKYNRQAFDHKARAMTEKYAKLQKQIQGDEKASEIENNDSAAATRIKLVEFSAGPSSSTAQIKNVHIKAKDVRDHQPSSSDSGDQTDSKGKRKVGNNKEQRSRKKLSLSLSAYDQKNDDDSCKEQRHHDIISGTSSTLPSFSRHKESGSVVSKKLSLGQKVASVKQAQRQSSPAQRLLAQYVRVSRHELEETSKADAETIVVEDSEDES